MRMHTRAIYTRTDVWMSLRVLIGVDACVTVCRRAEKCERAYIWSHVHTSVRATVFTRLYECVCVRIGLVCRASVYVFVPRFSRVRMCKRAYQCLSFRTVVDMCGTGCRAKRETGCTLVNRCGRELNVTCRCVHVRTCV